MSRTQASGFGVGGVLVLAVLAVSVGASDTASGAAQGRGPAVRPPVRVIFDTDIDTDVDDVGAVAVLHALASRGEATILAMGVSSTDPVSAACLDAINTYYGRGDIAIGTLKGPGVPSGDSKHCQRIAEEFPHKLKSGHDAVDVVDLYRRVLALQPDHSVVMISIGFLTNFANLLKSPADAASSLVGLELVRLKVRSWMCMGGVWPRGGGEWNLDRDAASSEHTIPVWPTPIVFSGFEIGEHIFTGARLKDVPASSPVRRGYEVFNGLTARESWDQTAVLYAVRGLDGGLDDVWTRGPRGEARYSPVGDRDFVPRPAGPHTYLVQKMAPEKVAELIEALMVQPRRVSSVSR